jgi:hypothetical protein
MNPTQTNSLLREENRPAVETDEAIVIVFPGEYIGTESQPATSGQPNENATPSSAIAFAQPWDGIGRARTLTVARAERIRALAERWNALMRFRAQTAERQERIRALTERWHAIRQARTQNA